MLDVTVILTQFKRTYLPEQFEAVKANDPASIWVISQGSESALDVAVGDRNFVILPNSGVWTRFYLALEAQTKYVCILDDDTIPGPNFLESCISCAEWIGKPALWVGAGVEKGEPLDEYNWKLDTRWGWARPESRDTLRRVDWGGHAWFAEVDLFRVFAMFKPARPTIVDQGEDMHFSYALRKYMDPMPTYVLPHPPDDKSVWSSLKGMEYGTDSHRTIARPGAQVDRAKIYRAYRERGWKMLKEMQGD